MTHAIQIMNNGFTCDLDKMAVGKRYRFEYDGVTYEAWHNDNDKLELREIPTPEQIKEVFTKSLKIADIQTYGVYDEGDHTLYKIDFTVPKEQEAKA